MPLLFSYGTLQQESVQLATFGRRLPGWRDALACATHAEVPVDDPLLAAAMGITYHANVLFTGNLDDRVAGMVLEVTEEELEAADRYEAPAAYRRVPAMLASGRQAWVYVHSQGPT
jgi:gamma-glutamylcyclotransferase (GGCT)/AIG2-like uncharacterized protein YtfP